MESVEITLPALLSTPQDGRAFIQASLLAWSLTHLTDDTTLLASELVANVVQHVGSSMVLRMTRHDGGVRVEVFDFSHDEPVVRHPDQGDDHGRGMLLVATIAHHWGTKQREDGKIVWFDLR